MTDSLKGPATKLKKYNEPKVKKSTQLRNTIVSEGEILRGRVSAGSRDCEPFENKGVPREVIEAGREDVESQTDGAFASLTFIHLSSTNSN